MSEAKEDVEEDHDREMARRMSHDEQAAASRRKQKEREDEAAALKLDADLNDMAFAMQLQESESKNDDSWERSEAARIEEDEEVAARLDEELNERGRRLEAKGMKAATKVQTTELRAFL